MSPKKLAFAAVLVGVLTDIFMDSISEAKAAPAPPPKPPEPPEPPAPPRPKIDDRPTIPMPTPKPPSPSPESLTSGGEFASAVPQGQPSPAREAFILGAVKAGRGDHGGWALVRTEYNGHKAEIPVFRRALALGRPGDRLIVNANYKTAQEIADHLGAAMLTPFVADMLYAQADIKLKPLMRNAWVVDRTMGRTDRMITQSAALEDRVRELGGEGSSALVANEGKHWVVTKRFWADENLEKRKNSANYGWHDKAAPNGRLWQSTGLTHDMAHTDYSQLVQLMAQEIAVDGEKMHVRDVLRSPDLHGLLSNEGPLESHKHPTFG